jgi:hypothetical protein
VKTADTKEYKLWILYGVAMAGIIAVNVVFAILFGN